MKYYPIVTLHGGAEEGQQLTLIQRNFITTLEYMPVTPYLYEDLGVCMAILYGLIRKHVGENRLGGMEIKCVR